VEDILSQSPERLSGRSLRLRAIVSASICGLWVLAACPSPAKVPTLPPEYYNCIEAKPLELLNVYFGTLYYWYSYALENDSSLADAQSTYDNQYFVFKNLGVADWMVADLEQGWIYIGSDIKCILVNPNDMKQFKTGDKIDVVGLNAGITSIRPPGLLFKDCYVLPAGAVKLPLSGAPGFTPAPISVF
jgi:hypothetical protein